MWRMTTKIELIEERLTHSVIGAFFKVHRVLGFGSLEHVYSSALELELRNRGHNVAREMGVVIRYEGVEIAHQRLDFLIDEKLVVEIKASEKIHPDASRQLYNYLRATNLDVGLLLHFGREAKFYRLVCQTAKGIHQRIP